MKTRDFRDYVPLLQRVVDRHLTGAARTKASYSPGLLTGKRAGRIVGAMTAADSCPFSPTAREFRLPPPRIPSLLAGALPGQLRNPDRLGRGRLAGLRHDPQSLRSRHRGHSSVPSLAASGARHRCCGGPLSAGAPSWRVLRARGLVCAGLHRCSPGAGIERHADLHLADRLRRRRAPSIGTGDTVAAAQSRAASRSENAIA